MGRLQIEQWLTGNWLLLRKNFNNNLMRVLDEIKVSIIN